MKPLTWETAKKEGFKEALDMIEKYIDENISEFASEIKGTDDIKELIEKLKQNYK